MADEISFTPDAEVHVKPQSAIRLLCAAFRSHEDGLPEWVKNSSDAYARHEIPLEDAVILVLLQDGKAGAPAMVGCLDFVGMSTSDIEKKFRTWADDTAAGSKEGVEGGHGNGGKCYMTQLFDDYAHLHTLTAGRASRYGFKGGSTTPGYFPSPDEGRGYAVENSDAELAAAIRPFGLKLGDLPATARSTFAKRKSFTIALGVGAKNLPRNKIAAAKWIDNLRGHQQMVRPIQRNQIYVVHNGHFVEDANPLRLDDIVPIPGAEKPRIYPIPTELADPDTGELVSTGAGQDSRLELRTSNKSMRWSLKARHTINGWTCSGRSTGYWDVQALSRAFYHTQIYGDIFLDALDGYKQNDRRNHSNAPLTRALREWLTARLDEYSAEFVKLDKLHATKEEQEELSRLNEALNKWKNAFLEQAFGGVGDATDGDSGKPRPRNPLPRGEVVSITLGLTHTLAGQGVSFRPSVEFLDAQGKRVRPVPHEWRSTDWAVATVDGDLNTVTTHQPGKSAISVRCKDTDIESNAVEIEVLDITQIELSAIELQVHAGSRHPLGAKVTTRDGRLLEGVYLVWTENSSSTVSVSSGGMVYGLVPGETYIIAADNQTECVAPAKITVLDPKESGERGNGLPQILLSEIDDDPLGEGSPRFSSTDAPALQRTQGVDANIWWINMASPLARRYSDAAKNGGAKSREWRVYHLERYIEIMVKIMLTYDFKNGEQISFETMLRRWEEEAAKMQQQATDTLSGYLDGGEIEIAEAA
ncbi:MAG: hypothetical protein ACREHE_07110 [Rhizomicrobium sp.]